MEPGCSSSFEKKEEFEIHMMSGEDKSIETRTSMDTVKGMFVEKMKSLSGVRSSTSSNVESVSASSNKYMKMLQTEGWALPVRSNFRFSLEQKNILYKCFTDGEKTGNKVSPEEMEHITQEQLTPNDYVTSQQIQSLFSRWCKKLQEGTLQPPSQKKGSAPVADGGNYSDEDDVYGDDDNGDDSVGDDVEVVHYHNELSDAVAEICPQWKVHDWVVVMYDDQIFPGQVTAIEDDGGVGVDCMHECFSERNCFSWPLPRDNTTYQANPLCNQATREANQQPSRYQISR